MTTPAVTHLLATLHHYPDALRDMTDALRAHQMAMHMICHAVGGEAWARYVHDGPLAAAEYAHAHLQAQACAHERAAADAATTTEAICCAQSVAEQTADQTPPHPLEGQS